MAGVAACRGGWRARLVARPVPAAAEHLRYAAACAAVACAHAGAYAPTAAEVTDMIDRSADAVVSQ